MQSDSKTYRFFFGRRDGIDIPFALVLAIAIPILIFGLFYSENKRGALSENPVYTHTVVDSVWSMKGTKYLDYKIQIGNDIYKGGDISRGLSVGDTIGVVYQKDKPENNMTVYAFHDRSDHSIAIIIILIAFIYGIYRWRKISRMYINQCVEPDRKGACVICCTPKDYVFLTIYNCNMGQPIYHVSLDCADAAFEQALFDCFSACRNERYKELRNAELIKAIGQKSWRQLYLNSTMCMCSVKDNGRTLSIEYSKRRANGKGFDWDDSRCQNINLDKTPWREIIIGIRKKLSNYDK